MKKISTIISSTCDFEHSKYFQCRKRNTHLSIFFLFLPRWILRWYILKIKLQLTLGSSQKYHVRRRCESSMKREIRCRRFLSSPRGEKDKNRRRQRKTDRFLPRARVSNERETVERIIRSHFDETNFRSTVTSDTT